MLALCGSQYKICPDSGLNQWLQQCPDVKQMQAILKEWMWLETLKECAECGDEFKQRDLRWDVVGAFSDPGNLICRDCWDYACEPTIANPDGVKDQAWPTFVCSSGLDEKSMQDIMQEGFIVDERNKAIGTVKNYNAKFHTGYVSLYGYEDSAEIGTLEPGCKVVCDCKGYEKGEIDLKKVHKPYVTDGTEFAKEKRQKIIN